MRIGCRMRFAKVERVERHMNHWDSIYARKTTWRLFSFDFIISLFLCRVNVLRPSARLYLIR